MSLIIYNYDYEFPESFEEIESYLSILDINDKQLSSRIRDKEKFMGTHPVVVFSDNFERIVSEYNDKQKEYLVKYKQEFISYFIKLKEIEMSDGPTTIPKENLTHIAMNCHLNVVISMLSSLNHLISEMCKIEDSSYNFKLLRDTLIESITCTPDYKNKMIELSGKTGINIRILDEVDCTFKKIMKIVYEKIPKNIIQYWDSFDEFNSEEEKALDIHQMISKHKPTYYVCNIQEFNTMLGINSPLIYALEFKINEKISYVIHSVIVYNDNHFFIAYHKDGKWIMRDCLSRSQKDKVYDKISDYSGVRVEEKGHDIMKNYVHSVACYVKKIY